MIKQAIKILGIVWMIACVESCANEMAPSGGIKDTNAPVIVKSFPENEKPKFEGDEIKIVFDELIVAPINMAEIFITPEVLKTPSFDVKGKSLYIKFKDSLAPNTTYTIHFGKAIQDVTEKNVVENLSYTFSTGDSIDKKEIKGRAVAAKDLSGAENIVIGLWKNDIDSNKPLYYTKTDKTGFWELKNLKDGEYSILAFDDRNGSKKYDYGDGMVGFIKEKVNTADSITTVVISLFNNQQKAGISSISQERNKVTIALNKSIDKLKIESNPKAIKEFAELNNNRDTLFYWFKNNSDSITLAISIDDTIFSKPILSKGVKDTLLAETRYKNKISPKGLLSLAFNNPVVSLDFKKVSIYEDSIKAVVKTKLSSTITTSVITLGFDKKEQTRYWIAIEDSAVEDIFGNKNKHYGFWVQTGKETEYGNLILKRENKEAFLIIELMGGDNKVVDKAYLSPDNPEHTFSQLVKGNYSVVGVIDENKNGYWDSGNYEKKTLPEKKLLLKNNIEIKGGWDVDALIKLNEIEDANNQENPRKKPNFGF